MQEVKNSITTEWVNFETFINKTATGKYRIFNLGNDTVICQENTSEPTAGTDDGEPLYAGKHCTFEKGTSNLYLRAANSISVLNVVEVDSNA